jgi:hypothetical protein
MSRSRSDYENAPSLYEIRCENGEIDEEEHGEKIFDYGDYYMVGYYKYDKNFPQEWALSHLSGTGPEQCGNCYDYGSKNDMFYAYCLNCAQYDYNGERGPGAGHNDIDNSSESFCKACSTPVMQVYEKSIGSDIYHYCSRICAESDFTTCSNCQYTELSKKDCRQQYLGGHLQYYCSDRCEGEDTTEYIRSFRKKLS